jgi:tellurite resistance protein
MESTISYQTALVYIMVVAAVADGKLKDSELFNIEELIKILPIFHGYHHDKLLRAAGDCSALLDQEDGLDAVIGLVKEALPENLRETAYALACDIVAADGSAMQEELRWLELVRDQLGILRLHAAAIERGARARYMRAADLAQ